VTGAGDELHSPTDEGSRSNSKTILMHLTLDAGVVERRVSHCSRPRNYIPHRLAPGISSTTMSLQGKEAEGVLAARPRLHLLFGHPLATLHLSSHRTPAASHLGIAAMIQATKCEGPAASNGRSTCGRPGHAPPPAEAHMAPLTFPARAAASESASTFSIVTVSVGKTSMTGAAISATLYVGCIEPVPRSGRLA